MAGNSFGQIFRLTSFGESHVPALGGLLDGCPSGLPIDLTAVQADLDRRRPGQSGITTARKEADSFELLSGVFEGRTTGAYEKDDYATAPTLYEKLWEDAQVPKFLYNAGLAREGLGHSAHALALWNKYLKQEITPEESAKAEARIATAQQRTTQVVVSVDPAKLAELGGTLEYQYVGPQSTKQRVPLSVSAVDAQRTEKRKLELYLEPGIWELKFTPDEDSAKVYGGDTETLNVVAGQKTTDVQMNLEADVLVVDVKIVGERARGDIYVVFRDLMSIDKDVHVEVPEKSAMGTLGGGRWEYKVCGRGSKSLIPPKP